MKTLIALIIALASGSAVYALEPISGSNQDAGDRPNEEITLAFADTMDSGNVSGECKAVCALPMTDGEIDLPWVE